MGKRVLLIESDSDLASVIQMILADSGLDVVKSTLETYFNDVQEYAPDVVMLDQWRAGSTICRASKRNPATQNIPDILTSTQSNLKQVASKCRADDVLAKPFDIDELQSKVLRCAEVHLSKLLN
jgi:two-component system alkaline phosphatase synthesis response regulator PhoP